MITDEVQRRSTQAHLEQFEAALANLAAKLGRRPSRLTQLEIDTLRSQADDLRAELAEYDALRSG